MESTRSSRQSCVSDGQFQTREAQIRSVVLRHLRRSGYPPLWKVDCEVEGETIVLHGVVPTYHMKQLVQALVLNLGNVHAVDNRVEVH